MLVIRVLVACVSVLVASPAAAPPRPVGVTGGIAEGPVEVCEYENVNLGAPFAISQHAPDGFIVAEAADDFVLVDPDDPDGINACLLDQVIFAVEMQFVARILQTKGVRDFRRAGRRISPQSGLPAVPGKHFLAGLPKS